MILATLSRSVGIIFLCVSVCSSVAVDTYTGQDYSPEALCSAEMAPDLSCGTPTRERWFFQQYSGRCAQYRTCSLPTKIFVNDFSSKEQCEKICIKQATDCPRSCSLANGTCVRQGNLALYSCQSGFTLIGPSSRVCLRNGVWSGTEPQCRRLNIAMGNVALESNQLSFDSGQSNIDLDCSMDPEFAPGSHPSWLFQRDKQPHTRALPWGVHSFWTDNRGVWRLRIDRIGSEQAGKYTCKAGILNRTIEVQVNKAPILFHKSSISTCKCGLSKPLFCVFQGDPAPNITWLRNGQQMDRSVLASTFSYPIGVDGDYIVFSILFLLPITMASSGLYQCSAVNERGSAVVSIGQLQVTCDGSQNVTNSEDVCRTSQWVLGAQVIQQIDEDFFGIRVKQVLKSPTANSPTAAASIGRVRLLGYSCWCQRLQVNGTYVFPGALSRGGTVLEVDLRTSHFRSMDGSAPPQNCS